MDNIKMLFEWVVEVSVTGMFYHFIKNEDSAIVNDFSVSADLNLTTSNHGLSTPGGSVAFHVLHQPLELVRTSAS